MKILTATLGIIMLLLFILGLTNGCSKKDSFQHGDSTFDRDRMRGERPNRSDLPPDFSRTDDERPDLLNMTAEEMEELRKNRPEPRNLEYEQTNN